MSFFRRARGSGHHHQQQMPSTAANSSPKLTYTHLYSRRQCLKVCILQLCTALTLATQGPTGSGDGFRVRAFQNRVIVRAKHASFIFKGQNAHSLSYRDDESEQIFFAQASGRKLSVECSAQPKKVLMMGETIMRHRNSPYHATAHLMPDLFYY